MTSWSQGIRRPERSSLPFVMTSKRLPMAGGRRAYFCGLIFSSSLYSATYHLFCIKWGVLCGLRTGRRPSHTFIHSLKAAAAVLTTMYVFTSCKGPSRTIHFPHIFLVFRHTSYPCPHITGGRLEFVMQAFGGFPKLSSCGLAISVTNPIVQNL